MEWLNYHHLYYFWTIARSGSIVAASGELRLRQPTISAQLKQFEDAIGEKLFLRAGRKLQLTEMGIVLYRYADQIFTIGKELQDVLRGRSSGYGVTLRVGISDAIPKLIAASLLAPVRDVPGGVKVYCLEDRSDRLIVELNQHHLDLVITDSPVTAAHQVKAFNHLLGECTVMLCAAPKLARKFAKGFPRSLDRAPFLLPTSHSALRRSLDQWFVQNRIEPRVIGEFDDTALIKIFGQNGDGIFAVPSVIVADVCKQFGVAKVAEIKEIKERFYAITAARKIHHPASLAVSLAAQDSFFKRR